MKWGSGFEPSERGRVNVQSEMPPGILHRCYADDVKVFCDVSVPGARSLLRETLLRIRD